MTTKTTSEAKPKRTRKVTNVRRRVKKENLQFPEDQLYVYKVMKRMNNGLLHSGSVPVRSKLHKTYQQGQMTSVSDEMFNEGFGICVFPTLQAARGWSGSNPGTEEIWKCAAGQIRQPAEKRVSIYQLTALFPKDKMAKTAYRTVLKVLKAKVYKSSWPSGAVVADWVVPIEKVDRHS